MLKKIISFQFAAKMLMSLMMAALAYHLAIMTGVVSFEFAWGGQLQSYRQMLVFETFSILTNLFMIWLVMQAAAYTRLRLSIKTLRILLWILVAIFALNTIGNAFAIADFEKYVFTPITLLSAILLVRLLQEDVFPPTKS
jgi:hypothetical protein